jgi:hypothetical protein
MGERAGTNHRPRCAFPHFIRPAVRIVAARSFHEDMGMMHRSMKTSSITSGIAPRMPHTPLGV